MRPIWRSRKFSFQLLLLVIFLATVATTNAGAIRHKRETINDESSHVTTAIKTTTETTLHDIESDRPNPTTTETQNYVDSSSSSTTSVGKSTFYDIPLSTTPLAQPQQQLEVNDNETTLKYADVAKVTTSSPEKLMDITIGSIPTATVAPKTTVLALTTLPQTFYETSSVTTEKQLSTFGNYETNDNITSDSIALQTTPAIITTTITESSSSVKAIGFSDTSTTNQILEITTKIPENEDAATEDHQDQILKEINTTQHVHSHNTENFDDEPTTTIDLLKSDYDEIATIATTSESNLTTALEKLEIVSANYDIATNEIKNSTTDNHLPANNESEKRSKHIRGNEANLTIPNTAEVWALASMKNVSHTKTKEGHPGNTTSTISTTDKMKTIKNSTIATKQLADWTEIMKNVDMTSTNNNNNSNLSFTSSAANSIENTLEGKTDDPVSSKITKQQEFNEESKVMPQIIDVPIVNGTSNSISTTPSINDILVASTRSIEKNKVEDVEDIALSLDKKITKGGPIFREKLVADTTVISSTTEASNKSNPIPTITILVKDNKTEEPLDTTTKRMERSTSVPTSAATTIITVKSTSNYQSTIPTESVYESTTTVDDLTSIYDAMTQSQSTTTETEFPESTTLAESTVYSTTDDSTTGESETVPFITSTLRLQTIRLATTVPSTTPIDRTSTNPPTTTQVVITETPTTWPSTIQAISTAFDDQYIIEPHVISTKATTDDLDSSSVSPTTSTQTQTGPTETVASNEPHETDVNVIIAISVSVVGIIALVLLVGFLYVMRKRQKSISYGQRCRPVSLDAYSLDNVSIFNSVRRKGIIRASKRSYGNAAFDDPSLKHNSMSIHELARFVDRRMTIYDEFKDVPQIIARPDEVPPGCEDKNRYANVIPLPETRVILTQINNDDKTEYINANYVRGPKDPPMYYIACQAPLESTVTDFWRMLWEQNSRVILMTTDLTENGIEKCAEYLPPSITLDNHTIYGDFQITLKNREVKDKYAVSTLHVKNIPLNRWREITHFWYQWPETGVPSDEAGVIAMLLEARSCLKMGTPEQSDDEVEKNGDSPNGSSGSLDKTKSLTKNQGPLTVHCSPGTGRTGTIISCDMALRSLETPKRILDIPQIVYYVRRGRASAVQTKEQYEFIYKVAHMYATKISGPINDN